MDHTANGVPPHVNISWGQQKHAGHVFGSYGWSFFISRMALACGSKKARLLALDPALRCTSEPASGRMGSRRISWRQQKHRRKIVHRDVPQFHVPVAERDVDLAQMPLEVEVRIIASRVAGVVVTP